MLLPKESVFPQQVIYNSLGNVPALQNQASNNQNNYFFTPCTFLQYIFFRRHFWYTHKGFYFEIKPQGSPKDLPGLNRHWTQTHTYFLAADSIAQAGTKHLLAALCLEPLHTHRVHHSIISYALAIWLRLGLLRLGLVQCSLHICEARRARSCGRTWERSEMLHAKLKKRMLQLNAEAPHQIEGTSLLSSLGIF